MVPKAMYPFSLLNYATASPKKKLNISSMEQIAEEPYFTLVKYNSRESNQITSAEQQL